MHARQNNQFVRKTWFLLALLGLIAGLTFSMTMAVSADPADQAEEAETVQPAAAGTTVYMPMTQGQHWDNPLGVEAWYQHVGARVEHSERLGTGWVRLGNRRVRWRELQPQQGGAIDWSKLADFEQELRTVKKAGLKPIVVVQDFPSWATKYEKMSCSAIKTEYFPDFANFMAQLVARYSQPEFGVHHWEIGNEPDVDPHTLVEDPKNSGGHYGFGCWGDRKELNYGGEHYGEMLKVVVPAIRAADPGAKVMLGGLLLDEPETQDPEKGHPERFLHGVLAAGAAPYLDYVAYHGHSNYFGEYLDLSGPNAKGGDWNAYGGSAKGKPAYLREVMAQYGVSIPLFLNESTLTCPNEYEICQPGHDRYGEFLALQANHLPKVTARTLAADVEGFLWFPLEEAGWHHSGLIDENGVEKPVYNAYRAFSEMIAGAQMPPQQVSYGVDGIESYRFSRLGKFTEIHWSVDMNVRELVIPREKFVAAYDHYGKAITPQHGLQNTTIEVGFEPIYVERLP